MTTTAMMEKKKVATQVPSGEEEEESGSTVSEPTARQFEQRWEEGRAEESPPNEWHSHRESSNNNIQRTHPLLWKISHWWTNDTILSHFYQNNHGHSFQCLALSDRKKK